MGIIDNNKKLSEGLIIYFDLESDILDNHIEEKNKAYIKELFRRILKKYECEDENRIGFVGNIEMMVKWLSFLMTNAEKLKKEDLIINQL